MGFAIGPECNCSCICKFGKLPIRQGERANDCINELDWNGSEKKPDGFSGSEFATATTTDFLGSFRIVDSVDSACCHSEHGWAIRALHGGLFRLAVLWSPQSGHGLLWAEEGKHPHYGSASVAKKNQRP